MLGRHKKVVDNDGGVGRARVKWRSSVLGARRGGSGSGWAREFHLHDWRAPSRPCPDEERGGPLLRRHRTAADRHTSAAGVQFSSVQFKLPSARVYAWPLCTWYVVHMYVHAALLVRNNPTLPRPNVSARLTSQRICGHAGATLCLSVIAVDTAGCAESPRLRSTQRAWRRPLLLPSLAPLVKATARPRPPHRARLYIEPSANRVQSCLTPRRRAPSSSSSLAPFSSLLFFPRSALHALPPLPLSLRSATAARMESRLPLRLPSAPTRGSTTLSSWTSAPLRWCPLSPSPRSCL